MKKTDEQALQIRIDTMLPTLNEYQRRRYLSAEAKAIGRGGISLVSRLSGMSRQTLTKGVKELDNPDAAQMEQGRSRKKGGGRKPAWEKQPGILQALSELVKGHTKGDPTRPYLWPNKSLRSLEKELRAQGFTVSYGAVGIMLKKMGYRLQADMRTPAESAGIRSKRNGQGNQGSSPSAPNEQTEQN